MSQFQDLASNSHLCAFKDLDSDSRHVFYQTNAGTIHDQQYQPAGQRDNTFVVLPADTENLPDVGDPFVVIQASVYTDRPGKDYRLYTRGPGGTILEYSRPAGTEAAEWTLRRTSPALSVAPQSQLGAMSGGVNRVTVFFQTANGNINYWRPGAASASEIDLGRSVYPLMGTSLVCPVDGITILGADSQVAFQDLGRTIRILSQEDEAQNAWTMMTVVAGRAKSGSPIAWMPNWGGRIYVISTQELLEEYCYDGRAQRWNEGDVTKQGKYVTSDSGLAAFLGTGGGVGFKFWGGTAPAE